jgi:hypothetical protein
MIGLLRQPRRLSIADLGAAPAGVRYRSRGRAHGVGTPAHIRPCTHPMRPPTRGPTLPSGRRAGLNVVPGSYITQYLFLT